MLTKTEIDKLREDMRLHVTHDLIEVIDALRAQLENIADDYPDNEKPQRDDFDTPVSYRGALLLWGIAKDIRSFLTRLDAGMPEPTPPDDNIGDIPF